MSEPITVLIVDDHAVVRQGVRTLLDMHPDLQVVGEAESAEAALPLVEELVPDVVLLDLVLPGMNGVEATRQMKKISLRTQIVVLTSFAEDEHIFPALRAGALSYLLKDIRPRELAESIRKAARGESVLHSRIAMRMIQEDPLTNPLIDAIILINDKYMIKERILRWASSSDENGNDRRSGKAFSRLHDRLPLRRAGKPSPLAKSLIALNTANLPSTSTLTTRRPFSWP